MSGCQTCQHLRVRKTPAGDVYECHVYPPEKGERRDDGTDAEWPITNLDEDCGQWIGDIKRAPDRA